MQAKESPSTSQSRRRRKLNSTCAVVTAHIAPLRSQSTGSETTTQSGSLTSRTAPTKDAPWLMKTLLSTAHHALPTATPLRLLLHRRTWTWEHGLGCVRIQRRVSQPSSTVSSITLCLVLCLGFLGGVVLGFFFPYLPRVCVALNYQNNDNMGTIRGLRSN